MKTPLRAALPRASWLGHLALALLATWPMALSPLSRLVGHPDVDVWNHAWGPWWFWTALSSGELPLRTALAGAPAGGTLWYIDPIGAALAAPLVPLLGAVGAYNAMLVGQLAIGSVAARRLARVLGAGPAGSWFASAAVVCSPYVTSEIHNGVSEAVGVAWPIFALAAGWSAFSRGGTARWLALGAWLGVTALGTYYYALAVALALVPWGIAWLLRRPARREVAGLALAATVTAAFVVPVLLVVRYTVKAADALILRQARSGKDLDVLLAHNAVDPRGFFAAGDFQSVDLAAWGEAFRHSSYLGWAALLLAVASRRRLALAGAAVAAACSLGPYVWWGDGWASPVDGWRIPLPFRALMAVLPDAAATHAQRLVVVPLALVAACGAVTLRRLPRGAARALVPIAAVEGLVVGPAPWPLERAPALDLAAHRRIAERSVAEVDGVRAAIVLDLPADVGQTMAASRYFVYQTASGRPIPYKPDASGGTAGLRGVDAFDTLVLQTEFRRGPLAIGARALPTTVRARDLARRGVQYVVVHRELAGTAASALERQLEAWYGAPEVVGTHAVFDAVTATDREVPVFPTARRPAGPR